MAAMNCPLRSGPNDAGAPRGGPISGRIVSMLWGALLLVGVFLLGRRLFGTMAGVIGMVLVAMSQPFLVSTHIVRPDIVVAALVVFALYFAESGVRRDA